jgi:HEAT repeat protein
VRQYSPAGFVAVFVAAAIAVAATRGVSPGTALPTATQDAQAAPAQVPALIADLLGRDWDHATDRLVAIGEPAVAPLLAELATGGQRAQRACLPLARIGSVPALDGVIGALAHADERVRIAAAAALRFVKTTRAADALAEAATNGTDGVRRVAAMSLGTVGDPRAIGPLRVMLTSESWWVRADGARSLSGVRTPEAAALLVSALDDPSGEARAAIRQAVAAQGEAATSELVRALHHSSERVRWQAAWAVGRIGSVHAGNALVAALEDPSPTVQREAAVAITRIGSAGPSTADSLAAGVITHLQHASPDVRVNAAWVLGELGSAAAAKPLVTALADPVTGWMAAAALGALDAPEATPALARTLGSGPVQSRRAAAWALSRLKPAGAIRELEAALRDADAEVGYWSRLALERAGTVEAVRASAAQRPTPWDREARRCTPLRSAARIADGVVSHEGRRYRLYPDALDRRPDIPSPLVASDGTELVVAILGDGRHAIVPATLRADDKQCDADASDFPTFAATGLHSEIELARAVVIPGRSAGEMVDLARPGALSVEGFIGADEDVVDVLARDNRAIMALGLTHAELARPLFHIWNMMRTDIDLGRWNMVEHRWDNIAAILSHGQMVKLVAGDTKGGQLSIFDDGLDGAFWIDVDRELTGHERAFVQSRYPMLSAAQMETLVRLLTHMTTGEMEPHYAMWYGFYEGQTPWRTDPIAIAFIFGLRTLEEIEAAFPGQLYGWLTGTGLVPVHRD